jgi:glycosyltransferase involved in cell wall biosynthesis
MIAAQSPDPSVILPDATHVPPVRRHVLEGAARILSRWPLSYATSTVRRIWPHPKPGLSEGRISSLVDLIETLKPDLVHSLEFQHAGYLALEARKRIGHKFPTWIATNWGADIHYFCRFHEHATKIRDLLEHCDYYSCETERDVRLGRQFGFTGEVLPVMPNAGGFHLEKIRSFRQSGPISQRRLIILKGYQGWVYQGLVGLEAIKRCADLLKGYRIGIYLASSPVRKAAALAAKETGLQIDILPYCSHEEMLTRHGRARISIGLSLSDGISTSFLEALVMGSFPIQSDTSGASEWIQDGVTGITVPAQDPEAVASAIRRAVLDDELVERAAEENARVADTRLDVRLIQPKVIELYKHVASNGPRRDRK